MYKSAERHQAISHVRVGPFRTEDRRAEPEEPAPRLPPDGRADAAARGAIHEGSLASTPTLPATASFFGVTFRWGAVLPEGAACGCCLGGAAPDDELDACCGLACNEPELLLPSLRCMCVRADKARAGDDAAVGSVCARIADWITGCDPFRGCGCNGCCGSGVGDDC